MNDRRTKKLKFLIIDDCEDTLTLYQKVSRKFDILVETTSKASEFVDLFNQGGYDVALVDFSMPINGIVLSRLLKKEKAPNTRLYFMTSHDEEQIKKQINGDKYSGIFSKEIGFSKILSQCIGEFVHERV